ncbi:MAG: phosphomannose isomerase type II C-terminal cupin domain [Candidatus Omnitrophica bacterium]|nr:phosphomannose isomerase type II C-terminal cupin domain [Candidatus Omnitrophota bacterium]
MDIKINFSERPWGHYIKFLEEDGVWVKRVEVKPGARLSLQRHNHRSEKWNVVTGHGLAIVNDEEIPVGPGSIIDVPLGAVHRIANTGDKKLVFIEVACGDHLSEEDIERLQDDYAREST